MNLLFNVGMLFIGAGWILLLIKPQLLSSSGTPIRTLCAVVGSLCYVGSLFNIGDLPAGSNFFTISGVLSLFGNSKAILSTWLHLAAIDLVCANFIYDDLVKQNWKSKWIKLCIVLLCFFAPIGFLFWMIVRENSYFKQD